LNRTHESKLLLWINYALHFTAYFTVGLPWFISLIVSYIKKGEATGTLQTHYQWLWKTAIRGVVLCVACWVLFFSVVGIPAAIALGIGGGLWMLYRDIRGVMALLEGRPLPRD